MRRVRAALAEGRPAPLRARVPALAARFRATRPGARRVSARGRGMPAAVRPCQGPHPGAALDAGGRRAAPPGGAPRRDGRRSKVRTKAKRIHELAKEWGQSTKDVLACADRLGMRGKRSQSSFTDEEALRIRQALGLVPKSDGLAIGKERIVAERVVTSLEEGAENMVTA